MRVGSLDIDVVVGDVLQESADALICPANPWLNMSGGVNGAILVACGESIQAELRSYLAQIGRPSVIPGTAVRTSAGTLPFQHIVHTVAIDPFYDSSEKLIHAALAAAFRLTQELGALSVAMPSLATGYGRQTVATFGTALAAVATGNWLPLARVRVVLRSADNVEALQARLSVVHR